MVPPPLRCTVFFSPTQESANWASTRLLVWRLTTRWPLRTHWPSPGGGGYFVAMVWGSGDATAKKRARRHWTSNLIYKTPACSSIGPLRSLGRSSGGVASWGGTFFCARRVRLRWPRLQGMTPRSMALPWPFSIMTAWLHNVYDMQTWSVGANADLNDLSRCYFLCLDEGSTELLWDTVNENQIE